MPYKNPKELLTDATKLPAAVEAVLPEGAPKISTMLVDAASKIEMLPDFVVEIPDLPAPPEIPKPGEGFPGLKRYVKEVKVVREEERKAPVVAPAAMPRKPRYLY